MLSSEACMLNIQALNHKDAHDGSLFLVQYTVVVLSCELFCNKLCLNKTNWIPFLEKETAYLDSIYHSRSSVSLPAKTSSISSWHFCWNSGYSAREYKIHEMALAVVSCPENDNINMIAPHLIEKGYKYMLIKVLNLYRVLFSLLNYLMIWTRSLSGHKWKFANSCLKVNMCNSFYQNMTCVTAFTKTWHV